MDFSVDPPIPEPETETESVAEDDEPAPTPSPMEKTAIEQAEQYERKAEEAKHDSHIGGELGDMLKQYSIQPQFAEEVRTLQIPQFFHEEAPTIFGGGWVLLAKEHLRDGFSLAKQNTEISFELATGEMYQIDLQDEGDAVPKYKMTSKDESSFIRERLASLPTEQKIKTSTEYICKALDKSNSIILPEIRNYVRRIVEQMTEDELTAMETSIPLYASKIRQKIESLEKEYREKQFKQGLDSGSITCQPSYTLPEIITPSNSVDSIPLSLYEAEGNMNDFEFRVISKVASMENIRWWHRIIERKGFRLNGFINHYPDFMVMTKSGVLVLIEVKGDHLRNPDSEEKLRLGRAWQSVAGKEYRYFMVFENNPLNADGAYTLDEFVDVVKKL